MQQRRHELVVVQRPVEPHRKPIGNRRVPNVQTRLPRSGEDVIASGALGSGGLLVDGEGVNEGDGEASGGEVDGQMDGGDYVALERVGYEDGMRVLMGGRHCCELWVAEGEDSGRFYVELRIWVDQEKAIWKRVSFMGVFFFFLF